MKACKDCAFFLVGDFRNGVCRFHTARWNAITGKRERRVPYDDTAIISRVNPNCCGPDAKHFRAKRKGWISRLLGGR